MITHSTKLDHLRLLLCTLLALAGAFVVTIVGAFSGYTNGLVIVVGLLLVAIGLVVAGSGALVSFIYDVINF